MTPENKIKFKANAQARSLVLLPKKEAEKRIETNYYVEGYAARYEPYVLCYDGDEPIYERFERGCFDDCDMSDVIMQFDHAGRGVCAQHKRQPDRCAGQCRPVYGRRPRPHRGCPRPVRGH